MREHDQSMLLHSLRVFQQYVVDMYLKIESARLDFFRYRQKEIRTDALKGLVDALSVGETSTSNVGRRVILPTSFIGGPRDMYKRYRDAIALVQKFGKPDIFVTMTCNPNWPEINKNLMYHERAFDRPDLLARVFRAKLQKIKKEILEKKIFGEVSAFVCVVEFQKRGMPHAHCLIILEKGSKPLNPEAYDKIVCAEIPDPEENPHLYNVVLKHMIHGPCGGLRSNSPCMKDGICKNRYPKQFATMTTHGDDEYPNYRRRDNGRIIVVSRCKLDNRWVVPYNPYLISMFDCHMNVEICSTVKLVKYMYKYIYKGHDKVSFQLGTVSGHEEIDEIKQFQDGRWIGSCEAVWRIYGFCLYYMIPAVYTLQVHLEGEQIIAFARDADIADLLDNEDMSRTMLTEFFRMNAEDFATQQLNLTYTEFAERHVWQSGIRRWKKRSRRRIVARMASVNPKEGDRYFERLLLKHVRSPRGYNDLLTVAGKLCATYRESAMRRGLLQSDDYVDETLEEATNFEMPESLRYLFAILLVYCEPMNPSELWDKYEAHLVADYSYRMGNSRNCAMNNTVRSSALDELNKYLEQMGKQISEFNFGVGLEKTAFCNRITREIHNEINIEVMRTDLDLVEKLNGDQRVVFNTILDSVNSLCGQCYFVDGPGGTGKTFLYGCLLATIRSRGDVAIAVATSGVAASILPGGTTAHSRFKIPLEFANGRNCGISKQSSTGRLIHRARLIIWDEASMAKKEAIEALDTLLRDIMDNDHPFGEKTVVFGGDFRQTLPVIQHGTRDTLVKSSIVHSLLWTNMHRLVLKENMRAKFDPDFCSFLLRVGEGLESVDVDGNICLPSSIVVPYINEHQSLKRYCLYRVSFSKL